MLKPLIIAFGLVAFAGSALADKNGSTGLNSISTNGIKQNAIAAAGSIAGQHGLRLLAIELPAKAPKAK